MLESVPNKKACLVCWRSSRQVPESAYILVLEPNPMYTPECSSLKAVLYSLSCCTQPEGKRNCQQPGCMADTASHCPSGSKTCITKVFCWCYWL
jgi:hypothetical protein